MRATKITHLTTEFIILFVALSLGLVGCGTAAAQVPASSSLEDQAQQFENKISGIKDIQKQYNARKVNERFVTVNTNRVKKYHKHVEFLEGVLAKVDSRAKKADALGYPMIPVFTRIKQTQQKILDLKEKIDSQEEKSYIPTIGSLETLKKDFRTTFTLLKTDLTDVHYDIKNTHQQIKETYQLLKELQKNTPTNTSIEATPTSEASSSPQTGSSNE